MLYAIIASLMLHASFLYVVGPNGSNGDSASPAPKPKGQSESVKLNIIDKPQVQNKQKPEDKKPTPTDKGKVLVKKKEKEEKKKDLPPEQVLVEHDCDLFYIGIGVNFDRGDCEATRVPKGYPAYRADIRPGDLLIREPGERQCPGRGEIGTTLTIQVMRGMEVITKTMIREKICLGDDPNEIK